MKKGGVSSKIRYSVFFVLAITLLLSACEPSNRIIFLNNRNTTSSSGISCGVGDACFSTNTNDLIFNITDITSDVRFEII